MTVNSVEVALGGLRSSGLSFDLLLTDIHMLKMDVFQFHQDIAEEFDIPICFMSNDKKDSTLIKGLDNRAVFFILKPITQDGINYLWNYATSLGKKKHKGKQVVQVFEENTNEKILNELIDIESSSSVSKKDKSIRKYDDVENKDYSSQRAKRSNTLWRDPLHSKFVEVVDILDACPKKVHELMNMPELSKTQIASHLQKYRLTLDKKSNPEVVLDSSKTISGNANQLSITTDHISALAPQIMTNNLNNAGPDTEPDLRNFMSNYEKDRSFSNILSRHLNQKPCKLQGNHEGINADGISLQLGNVLPNSNLEQEIYGGVTAEDALFDHFDVPSKLEIGVIFHTLHLVNEHFAIK
ncbi:two-component response regulator ARR14-like [Solanum lycopersicum]|uniref:two-component response regulator ARR14-like n=1 Tax=Solanum lycopersicum TaxID=4081 RepID=UPI0037498370